MERDRPSGTSSGSSVNVPAFPGGANRLPGDPEDIATDADMLHYAQAVVDGR
jgi:hypothetical protein